MIPRKRKKVTKPYSRIPWDVWWDLPSINQWKSGALSAPQGHQRFGLKNILSSLFSGTTAAEGPTICQNMASEPFWSTSSQSGLHICTVPKCYKSEAPHIGSEMWFVSKQHLSILFITLCTQVVLLNAMRMFRCTRIICWTVAYFNNIVPFNLQF